ncbi:MAG: GNAT family N-acetyltransferase [Deltaproteobacteria bacterium]|nr:GNAT family N-acetyltransferase [Deltaproteobacteria bacterium]
MTPAESRFALLTTDEEFDKLEDEWTALMAVSSADALFCSHPWMRTWWRHYGEGGRLAIATLRDEDGALEGVAPCYISQQSARDLEKEIVGDVRVIIGTEGAELRVLAPMGRGETCADYVGFIARRGAEDRIWSDLFTFLAREVDWDVFDMPDVNEDAPGFNALQYAAMACKHQRHVDRYAAPFAALPGDYEAYLQTLSKKSRYNARKKVKQIRIWHELEHRHHESADALDEAMETFYRLHTERWESEGKPGVFASKKMRAFHKDMARTGLARGWLRLGTTHLDGGPASFATYAFHAGDRVYLYQQGGVPENPKFNLGYAALAFSIEDACARGAKAYDFLRGEADYKLHWAKESRRLVQFLAGRTTKSTRFFTRAFLNTDPAVRNAVKRVIRRGAH